MIIAIIENDIVVNTIVAESLEIAQSLIAENQEIVDATDTIIGIGWQKINGVLLPKKPDYDCTWHEPTSLWLTSEEIDVYNLNQETLLGVDPEV
jgi:hypothetical protein